MGHQTKTYFLKNLSKKNITNGIFNDPQKVGEGYRLINVSDLYSEPQIFIDGLSRLTITDDELDRFSVKKGDIFFTRSSLKLEGIAHCNIYDDTDNAIVYECHIMRVRPKTEIVIPRFLLEYCKTHSARKYFMRHAKTTTMTTIDQNDIGKLPVPVPPIKVQEKIVDIVNSWNTAIEKTKRLIAAKETVKKGLMQRFLTGKKRLPGFTKPWQEFSLGDIFKERAERANGHLPLLSITREEGVIPRDDVGRKDTSSEDKSKYLRIRPGDIGYNTMRMWQGVSALSPHEGIVSPAYTIATPKKGVDGEFMAYLFKLPKTIHLFYRYSQGLTSDTWNLKFRHFREIKVTIPDIEEQKAIAQILKTCDAELALLRNKLTALQKQKRGLMQKLLTGQWRVKA